MRGLERYPPDYQQKSDKPFESVTSLTKYTRRGSNSGHPD